MAKHRGFSTVQEHDDTIIENINSMVHKKDKLFILGDYAWNQYGMLRGEEINCIHKELVMGNHDTMVTKSYLRQFERLTGFRDYKDFWLSHCPISSEDMRWRKGNLHGHRHGGFDDPPELYMPYFNVNIELHNMHPVKFDIIEEIFSGYSTD